MVALAQTAGHATLRGTRSDRAGGPRAVDDDGFTLIEAIVSLSIVIMVLTMTISASIQSAQSITLSRERQQAAGLAAQALEELRALPYAMVTSGLVATDLSGDANIVAVSGGHRLKVPDAGIDEPLLTHGSVDAPAPLFPHVSTQTFGTVTYTVSAYVTQPAINQAFRYTAIVDWTSPVSKGPARVLHRSSGFSPDGCLSLESHPYSGPCLSAFTGQAAAGGPSLVVSNGSGTADPIPGFAATALSLSLSSVSASLVDEQVTTTQTQASTTGASVDTPSSPDSAGQVSSTVSTSTDPTSGLPVGASGSAVQSGDLSVDVTSALGALVSRASSSDAVSVLTHAQSSTTCPDALGGALPIERPCSAGSATVGGSDAVLRASLTPPGLTSALPTFDLARIEPAPSPARAVVTEIYEGSSAGCPTTTGLGCLYAAASRTMGTGVFGRLPSSSSATDGPPSGFEGMVRVSGLTESARAEAGDGERAPAFTRSGVLSYWNGSGYTDVDLATVGTTALTPTPVAAVYRQSSPDVEVTIATSAAITVGSTAAPSTGTDPCEDPQCTRSIRGSEITVRIAYVVIEDSTQLTYFAVTANLGSLITSAHRIGTPNV